MTRFDNPRRGLVWIVLVAMSAAVFIADIRLPLGIAVWILYLAPVAAAIFAPSTRVPIAMAAICTALLSIGFVYSPLGATPASVAKVNRMFGGVTIWIVAAIVWNSVRGRNALAREDWYREGIAKLGQLLLTEPKVENLGANVASFFAQQLNAQIAAFYAEDDGEFRRIGGFALSGAHADRETFKPGEGLAGQTAADRSFRWLTEVPEDYLTIRSGVGARKPAQIVLAPLELAGQTVALLELGFLRTLTDHEITFLKRASTVIPPALRAAQYRAHVENLLEETQRQAEELEAQQEELRVANEELENRGRELGESHARLEAQTAELEEQATTLRVQKDRLSETMKELERASRYKSDFLANMSHELRTPLNSSLILSRLLADNKAGTLTPEQVQYAESIHSAGTELLALINDVLDLSKVEAGKLEVHAEPVAIARLVSDVERTFGPIAKNKRVGFSTRIDPSLGATFRTDPHRVVQILNNLLSNAFKFTSQGKVELSVAMHDTTWIAFAVRDTGIGIPEALHEGIFEAFRQADGSTQRKYGGTGLGLSISRELARLLGGEVVLESKEGEGSTFTLLLPAAGPPASSSIRASLEAIQPTSPRESVRPASGTGSAPDVKPNRGPSDPLPKGALDDDRAIAANSKRVLLVIEDDAVFARVLSDLAHELDFKCVLAMGADEGIELARALRPAAVLLDIELPDHTGMSVLDRLKHDEDTRHIPVHVISAHDHSRVALAMGAAGYVLKPAKREELIRTVRSIEDKITARVQHVLVVEDDPAQREATCALLETDDVRTTAVGSIADALEALRQGTFDCMVMAIDLRDGTGFELLDRMSREPKCSFPPVIVHTARSLSADEELKLRAHSRSIVIKGARSPERLLDEVTLFLHKVESSLPADRRRMLRDARDREAVFEGRRILIVEDDVRNIFALSRILEPKGARIDIARNGKEALDKLRVAGCPDLILMDVMMPVMDGIDATRAIRTMPGLSRVPIIAITAKAMPSDQQKCLAAGANDFVAKPIDVEKLLSLIRVWLAN